MPTKRELAVQLQQSLGVSPSNVDYYVTKPKAWLEQQLQWGAERLTVKATFNPALNVQLATNAHGHPQHDVCSVCQRWIGRLGYMWAWRPNQDKIAAAKPRHVVSPTHWHLIDAFCIECAAK